MKETTPNKIKNMLTINNILFCSNMPKNIKDVPNKIPKIEPNPAIISIASSFAFLLIFTNRRIFKSRP